MPSKSFYLIEQTCYNVEMKAQPLIKDFTGSFYEFADKLIEHCQEHGASKIRAAFEDYIRQSESDINDLQEEIKELKYKIAELEDENKELRSDIHYLESSISDD